MSLRGDRLRRDEAKMSAFKDQVQEQLLMIDEAIKQASREGLSVVRHPLPIQLHFPGVSKMNAQRIIYSEIIRSLERRAFEVRIHIQESPEANTLFIRWKPNVLSREETEAMSQYLQKKSLRSREEIDSFVTWRDKPKNERHEPLF